MGKIKQLIIDIDEQKIRDDEDIDDFIDMLKAVGIIPNEPCDEDIEEDCDEDIDSDYEGYGTTTLMEHLKAFAKAANMPTLLKEILQNTDIFINDYSSEYKYFISSAFLWGNTPQGYSYWRLVNNMYCSYCESLTVPDDDSDEPLPNEISDILEARSVYGSFKDKAEWIQSGKLACRNTPSWSQISAAEKEALDNILQKMGRILYGTEFYRDGYADICGYSQLVLNDN